ncbi:uncharacterized protein [Triticum aestivum]|uniref:uncharacterized protein n=1 Tax=Triticum aestivum TaxID=4565 RepID=UPI001D0093C8|nr:uncharacterized protein LOC123191562 [Triticum aestivum]
MDAAVMARTSSSFSRTCIRSRWELLAKIKSCYGRVKLRAVFDEGLCFGLLDPVSNIVAGVIIAGAVRIDPDPIISFPRQTRPDPIEDMNQRSLNGLVAFLAALFPYLTQAKAMWYLNKAELDPLVAARLIIQHRGMEQSFGFSSDTAVAAVEAALRCAAAAAQHPCPKQFVAGWKILSHSLDEVATLLSGTCVTVDPFITDILLNKPQPSIFSLDKSWDFASCRLLNLSPDLLGGGGGETIF